MRPRRVLRTFATAFACVATQETLMRSPAVTVAVCVVSAMSVVTLVNATVDVVSTPFTRTVSVAVCAASPCAAV